MIEINLKSRTHKIQVRHLTKNVKLQHIGARGAAGLDGVQSIVAGSNIDVDATDPANPIVSVETLTLADISDVTASVTEVNYTDGVTSSIQTQLNAKQASDSDLTAIAALTPSNDDIIQRKAGAWTNRTPAQVKTDLALTKSDVGLGNVDNTSDVNKPVSTAQQTAIDGKVTKNTAITGATKTKITYDIKGLITAGADATQDDIGDGTTYKQYSATEKTKLAGIETAADVTDTTNVAAAGAFMKSTDDTDDITEGVTNKWFTAAEETKLAGIEAGAEVNNISDANATDLTDGGTTTLHSHIVTKSDVGLGNVTNDAQLKIASNLSDVNNAATSFSNIKQAATDTATGVVELATIAEVNTGTDTGRVVTPDGLAGSYAGTKPVSVYAIDATTTVTTGDGKAYMRIPTSLNGMNLISCSMAVITTSSSGLPTVQLARGRQSTPTSAHTFADMLTTKLTIDATEYDSKDATTAAVIDTGNDDVLTGDLIRIDVDVAGTGTKGLIVTMAFQLP